MMPLHIAGSARRVIGYILLVSITAISIGAILITRHSDRPPGRDRPVKIEDWSSYSNPPFTISYPPDWSRTVVSDVERTTLTLSGPQGEIHLSWGGGFGGVCLRENEQRVPIRSDELTACHYFLSDGSEAWVQMTKDLDSNTFSARASAMPPVSANRDTILKILSTLDLAP